MDSTSIAAMFTASNAVVWVIKIVGYIGDQIVMKHGTGFSVSTDGLIMTCNHMFDKIERAIIYVRRLDENEFVSLVTVVYTRPSWDLTLLQVQGVTGCTSSILASNGSLYVGQRLFHIGHPSEFIESCLTGHVCYPCVEDVFMPTDHQKCSHYDSTALARTPNYRVMGDIWNVDVFNRYLKTEVRLDYEKNLHPLVPVIQCVGFVSGSGSSGGPVFNGEGEVVGMMTLGSDGFEIAVHVTVLREFMKIALQEREKRQHGDALVGATVSGEGSSERNRGKGRK